MGRPCDVNINNVINEGTFADRLSDKSPAAFLFSDVRPESFMTYLWFPPLFMRPGVVSFCFVGFSMFEFHCLLLIPDPPNVSSSIYLFFCLFRCNGRIWTQNRSSFSRSSSSCQRVSGETGMLRSGKVRIPWKSFEIGRISPDKLLFLFSSPVPEISWRRTSGVPFPSKVKMKNSNAVLEIPNFQQDDSGTYECMAENRRGKNAARGRISFHGEPTSFKLNDNESGNDCNRYSEQETAAWIPFVCLQQSG